MTISMVIFQMQIYLFKTNRLISILTHNTFISLYQNTQYVYFSIPKAKSKQTINRHLWIWHSIEHRKKLQINWSLYFTCILVPWWITLTNHCTKTYVKHAELYLSCYIWANDFTLLLLPWVLDKILWLE